MLEEGLQGLADCVPLLDGQQVLQLLAKCAPVDFNAWWKNLRHPLQGAECWRSERWTDFFFYACIYSHVVSHLFCVLIQRYARSLERGWGPRNECDFHVQTSGLLVCIDLERGKVLGTRPGDSSGSVWSEDKSDGPSSTTRVGIAPLPCSIDTTFSWEQFLRWETEESWWTGK